MENIIKDADAEAAVVLVSFQTLLSPEDPFFMDDVMRHVPVEAHYSALGDPWGPSEKTRVIYDGGFVFRPNTGYFCGKKHSKEDWIRRLIYTHGIPPNIRPQEASKLNEGAAIKRAITNFLQAKESEGGWLKCQGTPEELVEQLYYVASKVECFKPRDPALQPARTLLFLTTRRGLEMARAGVSWLLKDFKEAFPRYVVEAIEDYIPAAEELVDSDEPGALGIAAESSDQCPMHAEHLSRVGKPLKCCRSEVMLLRRVVRRLGDYISNN
uniref:Uncharacterized protein n=1 Tax=Trypanosoma congolense (strain IL3000) TaxID=1068625 RepID=G0UZE8_TRYCI|nr:conserved hypothetical protein [Trypanosoma congolense IL3000]